MVFMLNKLDVRRGAGGLWNSRVEGVVFFALMSL